MTIFEEAPATRPHPLSILTDTELSAASAILKKLVAAQEPDLNIRFKSISLAEPPKSLLLPYLDAEAAGVSAEALPYVPRCVSCIWSANNERRVTESVVDLTTGLEVSRSQAEKGQHGSNDR